MLFRDRTEAGVQLAKRLASLKRDAPVVVALPRGGVPVGAQIASAFDAPLEVCVVGKLAAPEDPERAIGAVAEEGVVFVDEADARSAGLTEAALAAQLREKRGAVAERVARFRGGEPPVELTGRTVVIVDDGIATGATARAAIQAIRFRRPEKIVLAAPVAASQALSHLEELVDEVVCVQSTPALHSVSAWYEAFPQVSDEEVLALLKENAQRQARLQRTAPQLWEKVLRVPGGVLRAGLLLPPTPRGLVVFAHGNGSSRASRRNRRIAERLNEAGYGAALVDLLTDREAALEREEGARFDVGLVAARLLDVTERLRAEPELRGLPLAYFGCSTGAAAALAAAASCPHFVDAVICRGGRTDLAGSSVADVTAPTLLLVGSEDLLVTEVNRRTCRQLGGPRQLIVIPGASHRFEEPGALEEVAAASARWLDAYLGHRAPQPGLAS